MIDYAHGDFIGSSGHEMTGRFELRQTSEGFELTTSDDFFFDGAAPGPAWAFGAPSEPPFPNLIEESVWETLMPFTPINGPQRLVIPDQFPTLSAPALITWCTIANVPLGVGAIIRL